MHLVRKRWNQLQIDDRIKLKGEPHIYVLTSKTGGAHFMVQSYDGEEKEVNFTEHYEANWVVSPDCMAWLGDKSGGASSWTECEQHYGIGPNGSQDPDPIRQLALAILKGDPQACDAARDILKC